MSQAYQKRNHISTKEISLDNYHISNYIAIKEITPKGESYEKSVRDYNFGLFSGSFPHGCLRMRREQSCQTKSDNGGNQQAGCHGKDRHHTAT
jgi:hypothetical protein